MHIYMDKRKKTIFLQYPPFIYTHVSHHLWIMYADNNEQGTTHSHTHTLKKHSYLNLPSLFNIYRQYAFFVSLLPPWQPTQPTYPTPSLIDTQLT